MPPISAHHQRLNLLPEGLVSFFHKKHANILDDVVKTPEIRACPLHIYTTVLIWSRQLKIMHKPSGFHFFL